MFESVSELKNSIDKFVRDYNDKRLHQSLGYKTPAEVYSGTEQAVSLILGKSKPVYKKHGLLPCASSEGLLSSLFLGNRNDQIQKKSVVL